MKKYLKSNCIKSELVQKDFSSILLKIQITSLDSQEILRTVSENSEKHILIATSVFYILQSFGNNNTNNRPIYLTHFE